MKWRWSLRLRFLLLLVVLLVAVFTAITAIIVNKSTATLKSSLVDQSKSFSALATQPIVDAFSLYQNSGTIRIQQEVDSFTHLDKSISQVEVVDTAGNIQYQLNKGSPIKVSQDAAQSLDPSYIHNASGDLSAIVQPYVDGFGIHRYNVVYGISYKAVNQSINSIVTIIILLSVIILLISLTIGYVVINRLFLGPVARLSRVALLVSKGDLNRPIQSGRNDEIGDLAGAVNTMANSLKADIAKLKEVDRLKNEFMMITSHNLRTPLTIIKSYLELVDTMSPPPELKKMLDTIGVNANRLGGFAEDVLTISTIEAGQNILNQEPTDMQPALEGIAKEFTAMAEQKKLKFTSHIDAAVKVNLSKPHFRSALWNLLDNAYKFTDEGGGIDLAAHVVGNELRISVKDSGIGIAAAELPQLFTKFHRGTGTLKYDYEGTGIGLYIAKLIVEQHGGKISVASVEGQGSTFTISLPVMAEAPQPAPVQPPASSPPEPTVAVTLPAPEPSPPAPSA